MDGKKIRRGIADYLILTLACFIFAFAWEGFMIPNGMSAGGMMGLCTVIQYATGGVIQAQYSYFVINALLIIVAVIAMGIGFGFKTIYCIVMSSLAMQLLESWPALASVEGNFFYVPERVLIPIIAGVLEALGIGLVSLVCCLIQFILGRRVARRYGHSESITSGQALGQKNTAFIIWLGFNYMTPVTSVAGGLYAIWQNLVNAWELAHTEEPLRHSRACPGNLSKE